MTSRITYPATPGQRLFTVPFPYISQTHVKVYSNRTLRSNPLEYIWKSVSEIEFITAPNQAVELIRQTPVDQPLVQFQNGAQLTQDELNLAVLQNLYLAQEIRDGYEALINGSIDYLVTGQPATSTPSALIASPVIDNAIQGVLDSPLLAELNQRVDDIDNNAAAIGQQTARVDEIISTVDGVSASYVLKTNVNGHIAGFGLYNTGATSDFIVLADNFAIATPDGLGGVVVPFAVDIDGVYMNNAYIRNLTVDKITTGDISSQWNITDTAGRIVLDTGTHMKVLGVGFGANSDLVEWFGPKMAIGACTKANGTTWVSTDGDAYFGGSLSAGTLYNAARTTTTAEDAEVVVGPFATNGNEKVVVVSYTFNRTLTQTSHGVSGFSVTGGTTEAVVELYRQIGGGSLLLVASQTFGGSVSIENEFDGPDGAAITISGSFTYTDSNPDASDRTFVGVLASRSLETLSHPDTVDTITTVQSLGIICTEE